MIMKLIVCQRLVKTENCKFKPYVNISWYEFCKRSVSKGFTKDKMSETSLNGSANDFSVDHRSIEKE